MWSSPACDLLLAAGQVSCVAASLYSVTAEFGPYRLTENNTLRHIWIIQSQLKHKTEPALPFLFLLGAGKKKILWN